MAERHRRHRIVRRRGVRRRVRLADEPVEHPVAIGVGRAVVRVADAVSERHPEVAAPPGERAEEGEDPEVHAQQRVAAGCADQHAVGHADGGEAREAVVFHPARRTERSPAAADPVEHAPHDG